MTSSDDLQIISFAFDEQAEATLPQKDERLSDWPAVYVLRNEKKKLAYIGESLNVAKRVGQHYASSDKTPLRAQSGAAESRIILDGRLNKSAALDLEAFLIQHLAGDGQYKLLNRNDGILDRQYFDKESYQRRFRQEVFRKLREHGVFRRNLEEIENDDLFKYSPYKSLEPNQEHAVKSILQLILKELDEDAPSAPMVVEGDPGTGKTIVAVFLIKLLMDIATTPMDELLDESDRDSEFPEFFNEENRQALHRLLTSGRGIAMVIPQQSLRTSIQRVFERVPHLRKDMVIDPFAVGKSDERFSLLVVDEAHRLNQRANQPAASRNTLFADINQKLFGEAEDWETKTQLDWIITQSRHQVLLLDRAQSVRASDLPRAALDRVVERSQEMRKHHELTSQMRIQSQDYLRYVQDILAGTASGSMSFDDYEFVMFDDPGAMHEAIRLRDQQFGLSRMSAGYAWKWLSKHQGTKDAHDIQIGSYRARWNSAEKDWVGSKNSLDEVGSIHTLQGYDLNYAGVIIGEDLRLNKASGQLMFDRSQYKDTKSIERNRFLDKRPWTENELLQWVLNIYFVLLTRGRLGTFIYVCDEPLRDYMRTFARADLHYSPEGFHSMRRHGEAG